MGIARPRSDALAAMMPRMIARDDAATYEICSVRVILLMGASEGESG